MEGKMVEDFVCKMCGAKLVEKNLVLGTYRESVPFCECCGQIETGTSKEIFISAKAYIDKGVFQYFMNMEEDDRCEQLNVAKICEILGEFYYELEKNYGEGLSRK